MTERILAVHTWHRPMGPAWVPCNATVSIAYRLRLGRSTPRAAAPMQQRACRCAWACGGEPHWQILFPSASLADGSSSLVSRHRSKS